MKNFDLHGVLGGGHVLNSHSDGNRNRLLQALKANFCIEKAKISFENNRFPDVNAFTS